ncbi:MAG: hypothetical protein WCQ00_00510 [bacterium]
MDSFNDRLLYYIGLLSNADDSYSPIQIKSLALGVFVTEDRRNRVTIFFDSEEWELVDNGQQQWITAGKVSKYYGIGALCFNGHEMNFSNVCRWAKKSLRPIFTGTWNPKDTQANIRLALS